MLEKLNRLLGEVAETNAFHRARGCPASVESLADYRARVPLLDKAALVADRVAHPPFGSNLTYPLARYTRFCQTSGTSTGQPMAVVDTPESWASMLRCWQQVFAAAGAQPGQDRAFFAFSFGPFLGFWTAFEAAAGMGLMAIPGGGMSTPGRLRAIRDYGATVLCCTPTYAIRLGEARQTEGIETAIRLIIVAGEPGGSVPAVRSQIGALWPGARVFDHHGLTETGPVTYEHPDRPGTLCVIEESYLAEILDPASGEPVPDGGGEGELVLTTLDRIASPLLRYRTGDLVRAARIGGRLCLEGGILGRIDDMLVVRGVNIYPSAIEAIVREFPGVAEFQIREEIRDSMAELSVLAEPAEPGAVDPKAVETRLREAFSLRIPVTLADPGELPRFEFKAKRLVRAGGGAP